MTQENIDSSIYYIFHINPATEWINVALPADVESIPFFLDYFFNSEVYVTGLLTLFFTECSNNLFIVKIAENACPCHSILFSWSQRLFQNNLSVALCKNIFLFWYFHMVTNFKFRISVITLNTMPNLRKWLNIGRLHFYCCMICFVIFANYFIYPNINPLQLQPTLSGTRRWNYQ